MYHKCLPLPCDTVARGNGQAQRPTQRLARRPAHSQRDRRQKYLYMKINCSVVVCGSDTSLWCALKCKINKNQLTPMYLVL